jgi:TonB family protein
MKKILMSVVVLTAGWAAFTLLPAQEPAAPELQYKALVRVYGEAVSGTPVTGAPYSAIAVTETTQTLGDGNRIAQTQSQRVYRDSQGRERTEEVGTLPGSQAGVVISDPVAKTAYRLNSETRTAVQTGVAAIALGQAAAGLTLLRVNGGQIAINLPAMPNSLARTGRTETLAAQNMEGVFATGTRTTVTIPAGEIGNQQPISIVDETWYSPELQMNVKTSHSDPRSGETVYRLTQISRAEPDPQLFQVPAGYTITGVGPGGRGGGGRGVAPGAGGGRSGGPAPQAAAVGMPGIPMVGGPVLMAKIVSRVDPQYTDQARKAKWQGSVILNVVVDETGKPQDVSVVKSLGMGLDESAMTAVSQWRFQPTALNGAPTKVQAQIDVPFKLQ